MRRLPCTLALAGFSLVCGILLSGSIASAQIWGQRLDGKPLPALASRGTRAVLLFFVATDCPISNRTFPEMGRLREEFSARGVRTWFVYPNAEERPSDIQAHQNAFDPHGEALLDPAGSLVRLSGARVTPQVVVLVPDARAGWRPVYAGRIDDRYLRLGVERPFVTQHFGEDAVRAVLAGRSPAAPVGAPTGCAIMNPGVR